MAVGSQNVVTLTWTTASELNNDYFQVECSEDGKLFTTIGEVEGAGTTTETNEYSFVHNLSQFTSKLYYRLKQVDLDGSYSYSDLKAVQLLLPSNLTTQPIKVYPTMASHHIYLEAIDQVNPAVFLIYGENGQLHYQRKLTWSQSDKQHIDISSWSAGNYYILKQAGQNGQNQQFVGTFIKL